MLTLVLGHDYCHDYILVLSWVLWYDGGVWSGQQDTGAPRLPDSSPPMPSSIIYIYSHYADKLDVGQCCDTGTINVKKPLPRRMQRPLIVWSLYSTWESGSTAPLHRVHLRHLFSRHFHSKRPAYRTMPIAGLSTSLSSDTLTSFLLQQ